MSEDGLNVSKLDVKENLDSLHAFDAEVSKAHHPLLHLETKEDLLTHLTVEHDSETWLWKDKAGNYISYISLVDKPETDEFEVLRICVHPPHWRRGIGSEMMRFAEEKAINLGRKKIGLATNKTNKTGIAFFRKQGYRIAKEVFNYYGEGEMRYWCEKEL